MRLCDICLDPDPFKRKLAVGRVYFERTDPDSGLPRYRSYDICKDCLVLPLTGLLEKKEV
jgi:hypothetical protein